MTLIREAFDLRGHVVVITGGAGMLGVQHAEAVAELGATPVLVDLDEDRSQAAAEKVNATFGVDGIGLKADITDEADVERVVQEVLTRYDRVDVLINNAANNPKVEGPSGLGSGGNKTRLEEFPLEVWNRDIAVGLTGAFLCSRTFGAAMARRSSGVIINVASDLGIIAPDQRLYAKDGLADDEQTVKPVTYSVVKAGIIGLTKYLATYWPTRGVRANAIAPGGVEAGQSEDFLGRVGNLIPMGRLARKDEYKAAIGFLASSASSYMNGAVLVVCGEQIHH